MLFMFYLLSFLCTSWSKITIKESNLETIERGQVGMVFYVTISNIGNQWYYISAHMTKCCEDITSKEKDCKLMTLLGGNMGIITANTTKNLRLLYPNLYLHNRKGTCIISIKATAKDNQEETFKTKINFNTYLIHHSRKLKGFQTVRACRSSDLDPLQGCEPVDCPMKYLGTHNFFNNVFKKCKAVPNCITNPKPLPDIVYVPRSNICRNLIKCVKIQDLKKLETSKMLLSKDSKHYGLSHSRNIRCHKGTLDPDSGFCKCSSGWTSVPMNKDLFEPSLFQYHMCNMRVTSWNKANNKKVRMTALLIALLGVLISVSIILFSVLLGIAYRCLCANTDEDCPKSFTDDSYGINKLRKVSTSTIVIDLDERREWSEPKTKSKTKCKSTEDVCQPELIICSKSSVNKTKCLCEQFSQTSKKNLCLSFLCEMEQNTSAEDCNECCSEKIKTTTDSAAQCSKSKSKTKMAKTDSSGSSNSSCHCCPNPCIEPKMTNKNALQSNACSPPNSPKKKMGWRERFCSDKSKKCKSKNVKKKSKKKNKKISNSPTTEADPSCSPKSSKQKLLNVFFLKELREINQQNLIERTKSKIIKKLTGKSVQEQKPNLAHRNYCSEPTYSLSYSDITFESSFGSKSAITNTKSHFNINEKDKACATESSTIKKRPNYHLIEMLELERETDSNPEDFSKINGRKSKINSAINSSESKPLVDKLKIIRPQDFSTSTTDSDYYDDVINIKYGRRKALINVNKYHPKNTQKNKTYFRKMTYFGKCKKYSRVSISPCSSLYDIEDSDSPLENTKKFNTRKAIPGKRLSTPTSSMKDPREIVPLFGRKRKIATSSSYLSEDSSDSYCLNFNSKVPFKFSKREWDETTPGKSNCDSANQNKKEENNDTNKTQNKSTKTKIPIPTSPPPGRRSSSTEPPSKSSSPSKIPAPIFQQYSAR